MIKYLKDQSMFDDFIDSCESIKMISGYIEIQELLSPYEIIKLISISTK